MEEHNSIIKHLLQLHQHNSLQLQEVKKQLSVLVQDKHQQQQQPQQQQQQRGGGRARARFYNQRAGLTRHSYRRRGRRREKGIINVNNYYYN
ncbi:hypothetical protein PUN28_020792 [Cardiocondyla obscurior]|uniref:Uncharacterized protein n=1 Tax=Cardiocondyla obscurior TaxID=286306 RepID=A0AAW2EB06_9HYME